MLDNRDRVGSGLIDCVSEEAVTKLCFHSVVKHRVCLALDTLPSVDIDRVVFHLAEQNGVVRSGMHRHDGSSVAGCLATAQEEQQKYEEKAGTGVCRILFRFRVDYNISYTFFFLSLMVNVMDSFLL